MHQRYNIDRQLSIPHPQLYQTLLSRVSGMKYFGVEDRIWKLSIHKLSASCLVLTWFSEGNFLRSNAFFHCQGPNCTQTINKELCLELLTFLFYEVLYDFRTVSDEAVILANRARSGIAIFCEHRHGPQLQNISVLHIFILWGRELPIFKRKQ